MKFIPAVGLLLIWACAALASERRLEVERSSDLERELGYHLSVQDKHDVWRAEGLEKVFPIKGPASEYTVRFRAAMTGKLKDIFALTLTLADADGFKLEVPLALRTKWDKGNEVSVGFLIRKDQINRAQLIIRCGVPNGEESYSIQLVDYAPKLEKP